MKNTTSIPEFDIKSVILREHYVQLHKFPTDEELKSIVEYAIILDERQMHQYLNACTSVTEMLTREEP